MKREQSVQDFFLNELRKERTPVTIFLMNGVKISGCVRGFDSFVVVLRVGSAQQVVYKHAISTMIPERPVDFQESAPGEAV